MVVVESGINPLTSYTDIVNWRSDHEPLTDEEYELYVQVLRAKDEDLFYFTDESPRARFIGEK